MPCTCWSLRRHSRGRGIWHPVRLIERLRCGTVGGLEEALCWLSAEGGHYTSVAVVINDTPCVLPEVPMVSSSFTLSSASLCRFLFLNEPAVPPDQVMECAGQGTQCFRVLPSLHSTLSCFSAFSTHSLLLADQLLGRVAQWQGNKLVVHKWGVPL